MGEAETVFQRHTVGSEGLLLRFFCFLFSSSPSSFRMFLVKCILKPECNTRTAKMKKKYAVLLIRYWWECKFVQPLWKTIRQYLLNWTSTSPMTTNSTPSFVPNRTTRICFPNDMHKNVCSNVICYNPRLETT